MYQEDQSGVYLNPQPQNEINEVEIEQQLNEKAENTLDEPVIQTISRDLDKIGTKIKYVLIPRFRAEKGMLKDCQLFALNQFISIGDLWGPMMICLVLALVLSVSQHDDADLIFGSVFGLIWVGSLIVTLNAKLLGGSITYLQGICVLGYCLFPIAMSTCFCVSFKYLLTVTIRFVIAMIAYLWSSLSSVAFIGSLVPNDRKWLAVYPIMLFYIFLSWFAVLA